MLDLLSPLANLSVSDLFSLVAVIISTIGVTVALWQVMIAKRSARSARDSAAAAAAQAQATIEQANLLREQLQGDVAERNQNDSPKFETTVGQDGQWGTFPSKSRNRKSFEPISVDNPASIDAWFKMQTLTIKYDNGPEAVAVAVAAIDAMDTVLEADTPGPMHRGVAKRWTIISPYRFSGRTTSVKFSISEIGQGNKFNRNWASIISFRL